MSDLSLPSLRVKLDEQTGQSRLCGKVRIEFADADGETYQLEVGRRDDQATLPAICIDLTYPDGETLTLESIIVNDD